MIGNLLRIEREGTVAIGHDPPLRSHGQSVRSGVLSNFLEFTLLATPWRLSQLFDDGPKGTEETAWLKRRTSFRVVTPLVEPIWPPPSIRDG
jgi:hypothetical protein